MLLKRRKFLTETFDEHAKNVIVLALEEAKRLGHACMGTGDLLLGILREDADSCGVVMQTSGIGLENVRREVERLEPPVKKEILGDIFFTPRLKRVFQLSAEEARAQGKNNIDYSHLMLGILKVGECTGFRALSNLGLDENIIQNLLSKTSGSGTHCPEPKDDRSHIQINGDPSFIKCRTTVLNRAIDIAANILAKRGIIFRISQTRGKAREIEEGPVQTMVAGKDMRGAAAFLMQNHRFFIGQEKSDDPARNLSRIMYELGDHYFYDGIDSNEAMRCYQLAVGLDPWNQSAVFEVISVCLQGAVYQPVEALAYSILLSKLNPKRNEVHYILERMMEGTGGIQRIVRKYNKEVVKEIDSIWPTAGGNRQRTGKSPSVFSPMLSLVWEYECGGVNSNIVVSGDTAVFGNRTGHLLAVDTKNGSEIWRHEMDGSISGSAAIMGGRVYAGSSATALCLDLDTGKILWKTVTGAKVAAELGEPAPLIANPHCVLCVNGLIVFCDDFLAVFDASTGELLKGMPLYIDAGDNAGPCADTDFIYIPGAGKILRLSLADGSIDEICKIQGKVISGPVLAENMLLYGSNRATLEAISLINRKLSWSFEVKSELKGLGWVYSRPVYSEGRGYFGGPDGFVYALDARTGKEIWRSNPGGEIRNPVLLSGKLLWVSSTEQTLCSLSAEDGRMNCKIEQGTLRHLKNCFLAPCRGGLLAGGHSMYGLKP